MDFSALSASRLEARLYSYEESDVGLCAFQGKHGKNRPGHKPSKEVFDALLSTVEGDIGDLSENLINANVSFGELSSLTCKDLELMGCKNEQQQHALLDFFKLLPKQERSYDEILKTNEAQIFNETILKRTSSHLDAMRSALAAANYKLKVIPSEDVVVGEKNFASRFVLDALEELQRVTDEIDSQLDDLAKQTEPLPKDNGGFGRFAVKFSICMSAALGTWLGFLIWKSVKISEFMPNSFFCEW